MFHPEFIWSVIFSLLLPCVIWFYLLKEILPEDPKRPTENPHPWPTTLGGIALGCGTGKWEWGAWNPWVGGETWVGCYMKFGDLYTHGREVFFFSLEFFFGLKKRMFQYRLSMGHVLWVIGKLVQVRVGSLFRVQHFCCLCIYRLSPSEALWEAFGIANWEGAWHPQFLGVNDMFSHVHSRNKRRSPLLPKKTVLVATPPKHMVSTQLGDLGLTRFGTCYAWKEKHMTAMLPSSW